MDKPTPCTLCAKVKSDGCSHIDCPNRKVITAAPPAHNRRTLDGNFRAYEPHKFEVK